MIMMIHDSLSRLLSCFPFLLLFLTPAVKSHVAVCFEEHMVIMSSTLACHAFSYGGRCKKRGGRRRAGDRGYSRKHSAGRKKRVLENYTFLFQGMLCFA